ncbi:MAG: hypothetical protein RSE93_00225 [Oscillospiraceae bacterium]
MPYLGIFLVLIKKPFSTKVTKICSVYCVAMCIAVGVMMATQFGGNRDNTPVNNPADNTPVISDTDESKDTEKETNWDYVLVDAEMLAEENLKEDYSNYSPKFRNIESGWLGETLVGWVRGQVSIDGGTYYGDFQMRFVYDATTYDKPTAVWVYKSIDGKTIGWNEELEDEYSAMERGK